VGIAHKLAMALQLLWWAMPTSQVFEFLCTKQYELFIYEQKSQKWDMLLGCLEMRHNENKPVGMFYFID